MYACIYAYTYTYACTYTYTYTDTDTDIDIDIAQLHGYFYFLLNTVSQIPLVTFFLFPETWGSYFSKEFAANSLLCMF